MGLIEKHYRMHVEYSVDWSTIVSYIKLCMSCPTSSSEWYAIILPQEC